MAQITAFSCKYLEKQEDHFKKLVKNSWHTNTVVFDSPGCESMLRKIQNDIDRRYDRAASLSDLDISIYLSTPNLVNSMRTNSIHMEATVYRLYPDIKETWFSYTIETHKIETLAEQLDEQSG